MRCPGKAVHLGLHLALPKVGDHTTRVIVDKYICGLCKDHLFYKRVGFYDWNPYLEITVQDILFVKVRHTLRDLIYHRDHVDSCGISLAQAL